jgi:hypothetical protein
MKICEVQYHSVNDVGIDLREELFSHMWLAQNLFPRKANISCRPHEIELDIFHKSSPCWTSEQ